MDRLRDILSADSEEGEPLPPLAKKSQKLRNPRRPTNTVIGQRKWMT